MSARERTGHPPSLNRGLRNFGLLTARACYSLVYNTMAKWDTYLLYCYCSTFRCTSGQCLSNQWLCDHDTDCKDGSDELNCTYKQCGERQFTCRNYKCIDLSEVKRVLSYSLPYSLFTLSVLNIRIPA